MSKKSPKKNQALAVIRPAMLSEETKALIQVPTPREFVKQRAGKGGKSFTYIEGGYVIARLNQVFSPVGWEFDVLSERVEQTEVIVRGQLKVKDHKNGYEISKSQYGTHPRNAGVTLGDTLKAATTDALKKCASMFGIGLDIYWQQLDEEKLVKKVEPVVAKANAKTVTNLKPAPAPTKAQVLTTQQLIKLSLEKINAETDPTILRQFKERIGSSDLYSETQKKLLFGAIDGRIKKYAKSTSKKNQGNLF